MNPTKRVAYFDPFSGASGDMILGALIDAGVSIESLREALTVLPLSGYAIEAVPFSDRAVNGTRLSVLVNEEQPSRSWRDIRAMITDSEHVARLQNAGAEMVRRSRRSRG